MSWWPTVFGCAAVVATVPMQAQQPVVAFVNVSVVPMDREQVLSGQMVLVRDERIAAIGPTDQVPVPDGAVRVDGQGKFLLPGLADMHVHIFGDMTDEQLTPDMLLTFLLNGITTVRDMHSGGRVAASGYGSDTWALEVKKRLTTGQLLGPHLYTAGDPARGAQAAASVIALKADGHDFVKVNDGWNKEDYDSIQAVANRIGLRIVGHTPVYPGLRGALEARWASIEHLMQYVNYMIGFNGPEALDAVRGELADTATWLSPTYQLDQAKLREIAVATQRAGVWNCPTLGILEQLSKGMHPDGQPDERVGPQYFNFDLQIIKALHDAGAGLLLGTDVLGTTGILDNEDLIQRELELLVQAGLTPYQALETSTSNVARFLGTEASTGTVAMGTRADLVLLNGNPLQDVRQVAAPAGVVIGGRWLSRAELQQRLRALPQERTEAEP